MQYIQYTHTATHTEHVDAHMHAWEHTQYREIKWEKTSEWTECYITYKALSTTSEGQVRSNGTHSSSQIQEAHVMMWSAVCCMMDLQVQLSKQLIISSHDGCTGQ